MIRVTVFIIALLLAVEAIEPDPPWLVALAVLTGIELLSWGRPRLWGIGFRRRRLRDEWDW